MTKSDLVKRLSRQFSGLTVAEARDVLELFLSAMKEGLESGDTVELRDFGVLRLRERAARRDRNPKTGETLKIQAKTVVHFKQSSILKRELNSHNLQMEPMIGTPFSVFGRLGCFMPALLGLGHLMPVFPRMNLPSERFS